MGSDFIMFLFWVFFVIALLEGVVYVAFAIIRLCMWFKHLHRRRAVDRRVISQAKGAGVWDKEPIILGGRALELKAKQDFKLRRQPGETDAQLRRRYMAAAAKPPKRKRVKRPTPLGGRALDMKAWKDFKIRRKPGETDAELRRRCVNAADNKLANSPKSDDSLKK